MCNTPIYVSVQHGLCSKERHQVFYKYCRKYYLENKKKLAVDHSFVYSETEKLILSKIVDTKMKLNNLQKNFYIFFIAFPLSIFVYLIKYLVIKYNKR